MDDVVKFLRDLLRSFLELTPSDLQNEQRVFDVIEMSAMMVLAEEIVGLDETLSFQALMGKEQDLRRTFGFQESTSNFGLFSSAGIFHVFQPGKGFGWDFLKVLHQISIDSLSASYNQFLSDHSYESQEMTQDFFLFTSFLIHNGQERVFDLDGAEPLSLPAHISASSSVSPKKQHPLTAILNPISFEAQKVVKMMQWACHYWPEIHMSIVLNPPNNLQELPTKSYYQYVLAPNSLQGQAGANFSCGLPHASLLTVEIEADPSWLVLPVVADHDLDNLKLEDIKDQQVVAQYEVASLLYQGQCFVGGSQPPQGLQLYLGDSV
jgi:hypothetical protein